MLQIPGYGRGLVATQQIPPNSTLFTEDPLACHPVAKFHNKVCSRCLAVLTPEAGHARRKDRLCTGCSEAIRAQPDAYGLERLMDAGGAVRALQEHCYTRDQMLPLLALRLACEQAVRALREERPASSIVHAAPPHLQLLCYANLDASGDALDAELAESYALVQACAASAPASVDLAFVTPEWYADTQARMQINHFRISAVLPLATVMEDPSLIMDPTSGKAVYILGSFFNHSCEPNVNVQWSGNSGRVTFHAAGPIDEGEQLVVSYIDTEASVSNRQAQLLRGWGFTCHCAKCVEESAGDL